MATGGGGDRRFPPPQTTSTPARAPIFRRMATPRGIPAQVPPTASIPSGAKARTDFAGFAARLKSCPVTKPGLSAACNARSAFCRICGTAPDPEGSPVPGRALRQSRLNQIRQSSARQLLMRSLICLRSRFPSSACLASSTTSSSAAKRRPIIWSSLSR